METDKLLHKDLTERIIKVYYNVYNTLGHGFLEKVYHNALIIALTKEGFNCQSKVKIDVYFDGHVVGEYSADLVINDLIILELKAAECLMPEHEAQLINYLRATNKEVGLLLNFGKKPQFKRKAFSNFNKKVHEN